METIVGAAGTGTTVSPPGIDQTYVIGYDIDNPPISGTNLFHSFREFSILSGFSARFENSAARPISSVLARVVGRSASMLDGHLESTIDGADLYFFNPNGIVFGSDFTLDVAGAFHASTADFLRLGDGDEVFDFHARTIGDGTLSAAPPTAFGFLDGNHSAARFESSPGRTLAAAEFDVVARQIVMSGSDLTLEDGPIRLVGAAAGEVVPFGLDFDSLPPTGSSGGSVTATGATLSLFRLPFAIPGPGPFPGPPPGPFPGPPPGPFPGPPPGPFPTADPAVEAVDGRILIRAGRVVLDGGTKVQIANIDGENNGIRVEAGDIVVSGDSTDVSTSTALGERTGRIELIASGSITISGNMSTGPSGAPGGADVVVQARDIMLDGAVIRTASSTGRKGGAMRLAAERALSIGGASRLSASADGGEAADISLSAHDVSINEGSRIETETFGSSPAGDVEINGSSVRITSGVVTNGSRGRGRGGDILVNVDGGLELSDGTQLRTIANELASGNAGNVIVKAGSIVLRTGASILADTEGFRDGDDPQTQAAGGEIALTARESITVGGGEDAFGLGATVAARSRVGRLGAGDAGTIRLEAPDLFVLGGGEVLTSTVLADAGDIVVKVTGMVLLDGGTIATSVADGAGGGGNINIDPFAVILFDGQILTNAAQGDGGDITIVTQNFFMDVKSVLDASSEESIDGVITIRSPDTDMTDSLVNLPSDFVDAAQRLASACAERGGQVTATLVAGGRGGLPVAPGGPMVSDFTTSATVASVAAKPRPPTIVTGARAAHGASEDVVRLAGSGFVSVAGSLECIV